MKQERTNSEEQLKELISAKLAEKAEHSEVYFEHVFDTVEQELIPYLLFESSAFCDRVGIEQDATEYRHVIRTSFIERWFEYMWKGYVKEKRLLKVKRGIISIKER